MSFMDYPNLAQLKAFTRDLNYTGFIADDWNDPVNIIPVVLTVLCLFSGLPTGFQAWWALINAALIHPMDYFVGSHGRGPKYLSDEYAVMDTRYWPLDDPAVAWISNVELVIMVPLCYFWYRGIIKKRWYRHYCALIVSTFQLMGCILYLGCEWQVNFIHLPTHDWVWPPTFNSYLKLKYFWLIFVGCNLVWITVPLYIYYYTFKEMQRLESTRKKHD